MFLTRQENRVAEAADTKAPGETNGEALCHVLGKADEADDMGRKGEEHARQSGGAAALGGLAGCKRRKMPSESANWACRGRGEARAFPHFWPLLWSLFSAVDTFRTRPVISGQSEDKTGQTGHFVVNPSHSWPIAVLLAKLGVSLTQICLYTHYLGEVARFIVAAIRGEAVFGSILLGQEGVLPAFLAKV